MFLTMSFIMEDIVLQCCKKTYDGSKYRAREARIYERRLLIYMKLCRRDGQ